MNSFQYFRMSRRRFIRTFAIVPILLAPGCQFVFGNYAVGLGSDDGGVPAATGGNSSGGASTLGGATTGGDTATGGNGANDCSPNGSFSCAQADLRTCAYGAWTIVKTCSKIAYCNRSKGACDVCADGEQICSGTELQICNATHDGYDLVATCSAPNYCDKSAPQCVACASGESHCDSANVLNQCNAARTDWDLTPCGALGCQTSSDGKSDFCIECQNSFAPVCDTTSNGSPVLRYCSAQKWKTDACTQGCASATATIPASCY